MTWIGHATVLVQMDHRTFLTDPIWEPYPQYLSPLQLQVLESHCPWTPPYEAVGG